MLYRINLDYFLDNVRRQLNELTHYLRSLWERGGGFTAACGGACGRGGGGSRQLVGGGGRVTAASWMVKAVCASF